MSHLQSPSLSGFVPTANEGQEVGGAWQVQVEQDLWKTPVEAHVPPLS